jgi:hypothetical protein
MPEPLTAEYFTARGVDATTAQQYATQHNFAAGLRESDAPTPPPAVAPPRLAPAVPKPAPVAPTDAQRAEAEMAQLRRDRMDGKIGQEEYLRRYHEVGGIAPSIEAYKSASVGDKNGQRATWADDDAQQQFERSLDAAPAAGSPWEYSIPAPANMTDGEAAANKMLREGLHGMAVPRELGSHIGESIYQTDYELGAAKRAADPQAYARMVEGYEAGLRARWGDDFDRRVGVVDAFLEGEAKRSPSVRLLLDKAPELLMSPDTMHYIYLVTQQRARAQAEIERRTSI